MKRSPMPRARSRVKPKRATPRRREAPRWTPDEWDTGSALLYRRAGWKCECCGKPLEGRAERHHRQRRAVGGDRLANLLLLRPECHRHWTEHPDEARERGIIVSAHALAVPLEPVLWRGRRRVLLDDDGGMGDVPS